MSRSAPIDPTMLLRDIVRQRPAAIGVLDAYRVDWCCGSRRTLAEACASAGAKLAEVMAALERGAARSADPPAFAELAGRSVTELVGLVRDGHHAFTRAEGPRLRSLATEVAARHGAEHSELVAVEELVQGLFDALETHMIKEERVLFPFIVALDEAVRANARPPAAPFGPLSRPIQAMVADHEEAGRILDELVRVTNGFEIPSQACASWSALYEGLRAHHADLRRHVWIENELLFPSAIVLEQRVAH